MKAWESQNPFGWFWLLERTWKHYIIWKDLESTHNSEIPRATPCNYMFHHFPAHVRNGWWLGIGIEPLVVSRPEISEAPTMSSTLSSQRMVWRHRRKARRAWHGTRFHVTTDRSTDHPRPRLGSRVQGSACWAAKPRPWWNKFWKLQDSEPELTLFFFGATIGAKSTYNLTQVSK